MSRDVKVDFGCKWFALGCSLIVVVGLFIGAMFMFGCCGGLGFIATLTHPSKPNTTQNTNRTN